MNNFISYAIAIFKIAKTKQQQQLFYKQIKIIDWINNTYNNFFKIVSCPAIKKDKRKEIAKHIFESLNFDRNIIFWLLIIIDNNHFSNFFSIKEQCTLVYNTIFNITKVDVISAHELNSNQIKKIKHFFIRKLKQKVDLHIKVNKKLVGGLKIQINNKTYDNTFLTKLFELKRQLLV